MTKAAATTKSPAQTRSTRWPLSCNGLKPAAASLLCLQSCRCATLSHVADRQERTGGAVKERVETKQQDPTLFTVVLLNDDYTTMEFVIHVLETLFQKSPAEAYRIMMHVHQNGRGIAGVYSWEMAETKADTVRSLAVEAGYPLRATIEEA